MSSQGQHSRGPASRRRRGGVRANFPAPRACGIAYRYEVRLTVALTQRSRLSAHCELRARRPHDAKHSSTHRMRGHLERAQARLISISSSSSRRRERAGDDRGRRSSHDKALELLLHQRRAWPPHMPPHATSTANASHAFCSVISSLLYPSIFAASSSMVACGHFS